MLVLLLLVVLVAVLMLLLFTITYAKPDCDFREFYREREAA